MKHTAAVLLALAVGAASAGTLPATSEYTVPVSLTPPLAGMSIEAALDSISKAAGFTLVSRDLPSATIKTSFKNRPFREVFETLINVYGSETVDYAAVGKKMIVVAPTPILARTVTAVTGAPLPVGPIVPPGTGVNGTTTPIPGTTIPGTTGVEMGGLTEAPAPAPAVPMTVRVYSAEGNPADTTAAALTPFFPNARITAFGQTLLINATSSDHDAIKELIANLERTANDRTRTASAAQQNTTRKTYPLQGDASDITNAMKAYYPDVKLTVAESLKVIIADVPNTQIKDFESLLSNLNRKVETAAAPARELQTASFPLVTPSQAIIDTLRAFLPNADVKYIPEAGVVIVRGTAADLVEATSILNMVNVAPSTTYQANSNPNATSQRVYRLSYAKASDILTKLKTFSTSATNSAATTAAPGSAAARVPAPATVQTPAMQALTATANAMSVPATGSTATDVPVNVVPPLLVDADERTNAIVAMGTQRQLDDLQRTIQLLDVPVSQVRLRVRVEQVQGGKGNELGLAWKAGVGGVAVTGGSDGLSVGYNPVGTLAPLSLEVKLNALASQGFSKTLMNTQFLTQDNQTTKFNAGGNILLPINTPSTNPTTGVTTTNTDYKSYDYGLGMELQPRIGPDGNIELTLNTNVGQKPTEGPRNSVMFEKQQLTTKISIKQGETVVLGGMLTTEEKNTQAGIPLLSEIPIIGALFRKTTSSTNTSDLIFILSADVINPQLTRTSSSNDVPRTEGSGAQTTQVGGGK